MSECVVRMEMPSNCESCPMCGTASGGNGMYKLWCMCGDIPASSQRRPEDCPIICSLPEGHGRLVDAELLKEILKPADSISHYEPEWTWGELYESNCVAIDNAPTIVPAAERSET